MNKLTINTPAKSITAKSVATTLLTLTVVVTIAATAWKMQQQHDLTAPLKSFPFVAGTLLAILYRITNPFAWNLVIRGLGHKVSVENSTRIWLLAESRRWLPGGIWGYTSRAIAAKEIGLNKTTASTSMAIELLVTIVAAACVSMIGVTIHYKELQSTVSELTKTSSLNSGLLPGILIVSIAGAVVVLLLRNTLQQKIQNVIQKFKSLRGVNLQTNWLVASVAYLILMAALNGTINSVLLNAVSSQNVPMIAMIAATATAWIIGFFAFFSPGGILVREAALAALLLPWLPYETGFALAILSRFAQLFAEVIGMGLAAWKR